MAAQVVELSPVVTRDSPQGVPGSLGQEARHAVTVEEAQRLLLPGGRVVGGASGLKRRVIWATCLRSRPPAFEPHGGGEFVLASRLTLDSLRHGDASLSLTRILEGLAQANAAALGLSAPTEPAPSPVVSSEMAAIADALDLPLIEIPAGVSLLEIERGIIGLVLDRRNELQTQASELYRQLVQLAVEGRGLDAIIEGAAAATRRAVAFEDSQFRLRVAGAPPGDRVPHLDEAGLSSVDERRRLLAAWRAQAASSPTAVATLVPAARWRMARYAIPVVMRQQVRGFLSLCGEPQTLTEFDQLAASRVAAVCALELAKEDAVLAVEQRVQGDLVDELLRPYVNSEATGRRAAQAGLSTTGTFGVFVFAPAQREVAAPGGVGHVGNDGDGAGGFGAGGMARGIVEAGDAVSRCLRRARRPALVRASATELVVICEVGAGERTGTSPGGRAGRNEVVLSASLSRSSGRVGGAPPAATAGAVAGAPGQSVAERAAVAPPPKVGALDDAERDLRALGEELFAAAADEAGAGGLCAGASRPHAPLTALSQAAHEAREALRIGQQIYGAGRLVGYADLGLYRLLHPLRNSPELRMFFQQTLGPLVDYDRKYGQNLIETLEAFFACHGNLSQTALRLQLHRNSLLYRIGRIRDIGGVDLEDPETRLSLQVALKARRLLD